MRGGILPNPKGGFQWHCFNCNFNAGWTPGHLLSNNTRQLFRWLGLSDTGVSKLGLVALQLKADIIPEGKSLNFKLNEVSLPEGAMPLSAWLDVELDEEHEIRLIEVATYVVNRGFDPSSDFFYWTPLPGYSDRVIIPFRHDGKIVGSTARKIKDGKPKYLANTQPGYVFNLDRQAWDRKFVLVTEGPFDAIAVDGCAIGHNNPNESQIARLNALGKEVIVIPDRDRPGAKLIKAALDNKWSVSMPPWEEDIKDAADAMERYGRLYTLFTILHYRESNEIKIQLMKKKLESIDE
jgi:hypothetical protein